MCALTKMSYKIVATPFPFPLECTQEHTYPSHELHGLQANTMRHHLDTGTDEGGEERGFGEGKERSSLSGTSQPGEQGSGIRRHWQTGPYLRPQVQPPPPLPPLTPPTPRLGGLSFFLAPGVPLVGAAGTIVVL
jgi:hypothetical protein